MGAQTIDGKAHAKTIRATLKTKIDKSPVKAGLAVVLVGDDPASHIYVARKKKSCEEIGMHGEIHTTDKDITQKDLIQLIQSLNANESIHGILVQLPLPQHLDELTIINAIAPEKDVDGLTPVNLGRLTANIPYLVPCTPQGVLELLHAQCDTLCGKHAVIIGRSLLFGKPMGQLLLNENCTVTQCHSKTKDITAITKQADILIAATGQSEMVKADWVKDSAIVIDVGITRNANNQITGDVDFNDVSTIASAITPVPGGVGPMTFACLLKNTAKAAGII